MYFSRVEYVKGYGLNKDNAGFEVEIPKELEKYYKGAKKRHITVSLSKEGKAVNTKDLIFKPLKPFRVNAELASVVY
jgi:hypothetical protein